MRIRTRIAATAAAVLALLAPAVVASADPLNPVAITLDAPSASVVYPVTDGYGDSVTISGALTAATSTRVRATVSVTLGNRVLKSWVLSSTGPFSFDWNGKAGTAVVPGSATILVRVSQDDGTMTTATRPLAISAKKVTAVTFTKSAYSAMYGGCSDDRYVPIEDSLAYAMKICPRNFFTSSMTLDGRKAYGNLYFDLNYIPTTTGMRNSLRTPVVTFQVKVSQSGSGLNYLCTAVLTDCRTFSKSGTYTFTQVTDLNLGDPSFGIIVKNGHALGLTTFTVKITYWVLK